MLTLLFGNKGVSAQVPIESPPAKTTPYLLMESPECQKTTFIHDERMLEAAFNKQDKMPCTSKLSYNKCVQSLIK